MLDNKCVRYETPTSGQASNANKINRHRRHTDDNIN